MRFSFLACLAVLMFVGSEAVGRRVPVYLFNSRVPIYYYSTATTDASRYQSSQRPVNPAAGMANQNTYGPYYRQVACPARTFLFEACTMCYCTDIPNVGLCWDYQGAKCAQTQRLIDEQRGAVNSDPNGVW